MPQVLKGLATALAVCVLAVGGYAWWVQRDTGRLRALCDALQPGLSLDEVSVLVKSAGFSAPSLRRGGVADGPHGERLVLVPAPSTMGETVCLIRVQAGRVLAAHMQGPQA